MITLGITGRSGCGKSTVTAVFAAHGVPLADADQLSREILLPGSPLLPQLAARFGGDILKPDGTLDRRLLADRAFATPEGKAALDSLTHPAIVARIRAAKQAAQAAGAPLFVLDGAVIVGTAAQAECDRLCVVTAPFETSVARIVARDGISPEMAARRLNAQTPERTLTAQADYTLHNDAGLEALQAAAARLCERLQAEGGRDGSALNEQNYEKSLRPHRRPGAARRGKNSDFVNSSAAVSWCCGWLRCAWLWCLRCVPCRPCATGQSSFCTPRKYEQLVEKWAAAYELDPLLVYAFIRTESGFDPQATSSVDARGLMQMTEETFLWMRSKIAPEEPLTFADLYDPDTAIRFGCYYLHLCMVRYKGDVSTAAAAYHSGWGTVDQLLQIEEHSADGGNAAGLPL